MDNNLPPNQPVASVPPVSTIPAEPINTVYSTPVAPSVPQASNSKHMIIIAIAIIFVVSAVVGGLVWMNMAAKREMQTIVQAQVTDFSDLEKSYKSIRTIIDEKTVTPDAEATNLLKAKPTKISEVNVDVLGAEEDLNISMNRKIAEQYKKGRLSIKNVTSNNTKIANVYSGNPLIKPFLPDATVLITKTKDFAGESEALLGYMNQINNLEISSKTLGYQIGLALQESILRNADSESVSKFKVKVNELNDIYDKYKAIDISELPDDLQKSHNESLSTFDKDVAIFSELVTALERKDGAMLQQAIQSLIIQSESETTAAEIEIRNFWNEHETINAATTLKSEWKVFGEEKLGIAF